MTACRSPGAYSTTTAYRRGPAGPVPSRGPPTGRALRPAAGIENSGSISSTFSFHQLRLIVGYGQVHGLAHGLGIGMRAVNVFRVQVLAQRVGQLGTRLAAALGPVELTQLQGGVRLLRAGQGEQRDVVAIHAPLNFNAVVDDGLEPRGIDVKEAQQLGA